MLVSTMHHVQEVVRQLHELLAGAPCSEQPAPAAAAVAAAGADSHADCSQQSQPHGSSSKFGISVHPKVSVAVLLEGSGPHTVDLSTGVCVYTTGGCAALCWAVLCCN